MFCWAPRYRDRLPRTNLGTRRISLPHPAATGGVIAIAALYERRTNESAVIGRRYSFNQPQVPAYIRCLTLHREDLVDAFVARQT